MGDEVIVQISNCNNEQRPSFGNENFVTPGRQEIEAAEGFDTFNGPTPTTDNRGEQTARLAGNIISSHGQTKLSGAGELRVGVCECVADTARQTLHRSNSSQSD